MSESNTLERVIRPIVEGQIASFFNDYPDLAKMNAGSRFGKAVTVGDYAGSLSKRIVRDLLCAETRVRLEAAILQGISGKAA